MLSKIFLKTTSYGVMHMCIAILVAYVLSGSWGIALAIGLIEPCIQTLAFFFHERAWHAYEKKHKMDDAHNSVIDSTSPMSGAVEHLLHRHKKH